MDAVVNGRVVKADIVQAADRLIKLKKTANLWEVVGEVLEVWKKRNPKVWKAHVITVKDLRQTRKDEYASTKDKETGGYLRYTVDVPEQVVMMLRMLYSAEELPMNKEFWREFAKRFPAFSVAEKI